MLDWYEHLYVGERAAKHVRRTIRRVNQRKVTPEIYLLTFPSNDCNVMEIVSSHILLQKTPRLFCPTIIGLAKGKEEAYELMKEIIMETYNNTGNFRVKDYLKDR